MKNVIKLLVAIFTLVAIMFTFCGCDIITGLLPGGNVNNGPVDGEEEEEEDTPGSASYTTFEAEGVDFAGLYASGPSNSLVGTELIFGANTPLEFNENEKVLNSISNGYCIGNMTNPENNIDFVIISDADAQDCTLKIRMAIFNGSVFENNTMKLNSDILEIYVNGVKLEYDTIDIKGGAVAKLCTTQFKDYTISAKFDLKEGENIIRLKAVQNDVAAYIESDGASAGAPAIDCIKVKSTSTLTWESNWETNKIEMGI